MKFKYLREMCIETGVDMRECLDEYIINMHFMNEYLMLLGKPYQSIHIIDDIDDQCDETTEIVDRVRDGFDSLHCLSRELVLAKNNFIICLHEMNAIYLQKDLDDRDNELKLHKASTLVKNAEYNSCFDDYEECLSRLDEIVQVSLSFVLNDNVEFCSICIYGNKTERDEKVSHIVIPPEFFQSIKAIDYRENDNDNDVDSDISKILSDSSIGDDIKFSSEEAERKIICYLLRNWDGSHGKVFNELSLEHFINEVNRNIYLELENLSLSKTGDKELSFMFISQSLSLGDSSMDWINFSNRLISFKVNHENIMQYCDILKRRKILRDLHKSTNALSDDIRKGAI